MSVGNDYLGLIAELWNMEQLDMWNPKEHSSLAYLLDRSFSQTEYPAQYAHWLSLAKSRDLNEFAWSVSQAIVLVSKQDSRISEGELADLDRLLALQRTRYMAKRLSGFGFVKDKYVPDWFFELFGAYMPLEELKRENAVIGYLKSACGMSEHRAEDAYRKLSMHDDILNEFYFYVKNRRFPSFDPVTAEGFSAQQLVDSTYLAPLGAYNYLIYLREAPEEALADLKNGLPRK